jgi:hypothetical protein
MQADTTLPADQRRNYKGVGDALARIVREEGAGGLFTGAGPTVVRAMALNMGMLASNDQAKEIIEGLGFEKGSSVVVLGAAGIAGFFASACSLPFDYVKTQMQKMKPDATGKLPYTGSIDCAVKTFKEGGPLKFYTGFPTFFIRIGEHWSLGVLASGSVAQRAHLSSPCSTPIGPPPFTRSSPRHDHLNHPQRAAWLGGQDRAVAPPARISQGYDICAFV